MSGDIWLYFLAGAGLAANGFYWGWEARGREVRHWKMRAKHLEAAQNAPVVNYREWRREHFGDKGTPVSDPPRAYLNRLRRDFPTMTKIADEVEADLDKVQAELDAEPPPNESRQRP